MPARDLRGALLGLALLLASGCALLEGPRGRERSLVVTATAYNSLPGQTNANPALAAWGDRLEPGMKAIAVSHDLVELGLERGVAVEIEGLPGSYTVLDKMARRWRRKIDVYMGEDVAAARAWGRRQVTIRWRER